MSYDLYADISSPEAEPVKKSLFDAPHDLHYDSHLENATLLASASHQNGAGGSGSGASAVKHEDADSRMVDSLPRKPMQSQSQSQSQLQSQTQPSAILAHVPDRRGGPGDFGTSTAMPSGSGPSSLPKAPSTLPLNPNLPQNPMTAFKGQQHQPQQLGRSPSSILSSGGQGSSTMSALYLGDLPWWVSDDAVRGVCEEIGSPVALKHIAFSEHKVNGKSKGVAYIEFPSPDDASRVKGWFEAHDWHGKRMTVELASVVPGYHPFKTLPKEPYSRDRQSHNPTSSSSNNASSAPPPRPAQSRHVSSHHNPPPHHSNPTPSPYPPQQSYSSSPLAPTMPVPFSQAPSMMMPPFAGGAMGFPGFMPPHLQMMQMMGGMGMGMGGGAQPFSQQQLAAAFAAAGGGMVNPAFYGASEGIDEADGSRKRSRVDG